MKIQSGIYNYSIKQTPPQKPDKFVQSPITQAKTVAPQIGFYGLVAPVATKIKAGITEADFQKALNYLKVQKNLLQKKPEELSLNDFDLDKLNGIQRGIKVFEGWSMKQVAFLADNLHQVLSYRGCGGGCGHCAQNAVPQQYLNLKKNLNLNTINQMSGEDREATMNGFKQINEAVGFNIFKNSKKKYIAPFVDSNGVELLIESKNGQKMEFPEIADELYNATGKPIIFDDSGWDPNNKQLQERAERIVEYLKEEKNMDKMVQVNISINPFHSVYNNDLAKLASITNFEDYSQYKDRYVKRMANAIFTFTPIINHPKMDFIIRAIRNGHAKRIEHEDKNMESLSYSIVDAVMDLYKKDLAGPKKVIKNEADIRKAENRLYDAIEERQYITPIGRAKDKFKPESKRIQKAEKKKIKHRNKLLVSLKDSKTFNAGIDANGKIFLNNEYETIPTELQLNFENKHKLTLPYGDVNHKIKITNEMIEKAYTTKASTPPNIKNFKNPVNEYSPSNN